MKPAAKKPVAKKASAKEFAAKKFAAKKTPVKYKATPKKKLAVDGQENTKEEGCNKENS